MFLHNFVRIKFSAAVNRYNVLALHTQNFKFSEGRDITRVNITYRDVTTPEALTFPNCNRPCQRWVK
jgi:hypothetical protein